MTDADYDRLEALLQELLDVVKGDYEHPVYRVVLCIGDILMEYDAKRYPPIEPLRGRELLRVLAVGCR